MDKVRLGRRLGIGTRLAAKVLREQAGKATSTVGARQPIPAEERRPEERRIPTPGAPRPAARRTPVPSSVVRQAARGGRGFGRAFWGSFARAGRALWHEVTGVFFALFALFFLQGLWRLRGGWRSGPEHRHFEI
ncbi:MAG: hypothetical protein RB191_22270, partial [Terriglobia bacterium]|nr:hypothetical protein [Terriglobia bacterium]